jgi:hypothetical protein
MVNKTELQEIRDQKLEIKRQMLNLEDMYEALCHKEDAVKDKLMGVN